MTLGPFKQKTKDFRGKLPVGPGGKPNQAEAGQRPKRVWFFGSFQLDEEQRVLRGAVEPISYGSKPWLVLVQLLEGRGKPVDKEVTMKSVWPNSYGADDSYKNAIMELRKALGDQKLKVVIVSAGGGHKIGVDVRFDELLPAPRMILRKGMPLPGERVWLLEQLLSSQDETSVWTAQKDLKEICVCKFAEGAAQVQKLRNEFDLSTTLAGQHPTKTCFVRALGQYQELETFYIKTEFAGENLVRWTERQLQEGRILSLELALNIMRQVCDAVATLHASGIVHNNLTPSAILIAPNGEVGDWNVRLTGLGNAVQLGTPDSREPSGSVPRRPIVELHPSIYRPPEAPKGEAVEKTNDIYALGVILFQMLRGNFSVSPTGAWQKFIPSTILQDDIEAAVAQDPGLRLKTVDDFAVRLANAQIRQSKRDLVASRTKLIAVMSLSSGVVVVLLTILFFVVRASQRDRDAAAIDGFLTEDLLRESNPAHGKGLNETLHQAIDSVRPQIEKRFAGRPRIAAKVHEEIAEALGNGADVEGAGSEFDAAANDWIQAEGEHSENAIYAQLQHAFLELKSQRAGSIDLAKQLLTKELPAIQSLRHPSPKVIFARLDVEGMIALSSGDSMTAKRKFQDAMNLASADPSISVERRLSEQARLCFIQAHTGEAGEAVACFKSLVPRYKKTYGEGSARFLNLRINLAQALLLDKQFAAALKESDELYPLSATTFGAANQVTQSVLGFRAQSEAGLARWDDAIRDMLSLAETATNTDPYGFLAVSGYADAGKLECDQNRLEAGEGHAREALAAASAVGESRGLLGNAQYSVAYCILASTSKDGISTSRLAEVQRLLDSIDVPSVAAIAADPGWSANVDLARAQLAFAQKNYASAREYLAKAKPSFDSPDAEFYQRQTMEKLESDLKRIVITK